MYGKSVHVSVWEKRQSERNGHIQVHRRNYIDRIVTKEQADAMHDHFNIEAANSSQE